MAAASQNAGAWSLEGERTAELAHFVSVIRGLWGVHDYSMTIYFNYILVGAVSDLY